jgi:hypothetical protein
MRARALTRPFPVPRLDAPATEVARLLAADAVGIAVLTDRAGALEGAVTDTELLWFLLPAHLHQDHTVAGVLNKAAAEGLRADYTSALRTRLLGCI